VSRSVASATRQIGTAIRAERVATLVTATTNQSAPITVVLSRTPKAGYDAELGQWLREVLVVASGFPGCLGVEVVAPNPPHTTDFVIVFRWATKHDFDGWHDSPERERWLESVEDFSEEPVVQTISGLEPWFTVAGTPRASVAPAKWKMALVTFAVIWPLSTALAIADGPFVHQLPVIGRTFVTTLVLIPLLTWVVMPAATRLLSRWLAPSR
jgi:antibiotic biosynthesis monooxygenase (ABM) superfamily enzyme